MIEVIVFLFGLVIGSFLNAVIYRLSVNKSAFFGRSFCPSCKHTLKTRDLIPVISFILQRGLCRYCSMLISWQYPIVELGTAISFLLIYGRLQTLFGLTPELIPYFFIYACFTAFLIVIFVYDLKHYLILDTVVIPAVMIAFLSNILLQMNWMHMVLAAFIAGGFFALQFLVSKGTWIGGGDIRLGVLMGVMVSWPVILVALFVSYIIGGVWAVALLISGQKKMGSKLPFGTFLTVGTFIALLYGDSIIQWYLRIALL